MSTYSTVKYQKFFGSFFQKRTFFLPLACLFLCASANASPRLKCGVVTEALDWNKDDLHGGLVPLDVEICRATATALYGAPDKFDLQSYTTEEDGLVALHKGQTDMVVGATPSLVRSNIYHARYSLPFFQDGQGFMVHSAEGVHSLGDITGHKLCYIEDTDNDRIALAYLAAHGIKPVAFGFQEEGEMDAAIMDRHCQVTTAYLSKLAEARATFHNAHEYVFLPDLLNLVPATVATDAQNTRLGNVIDTVISVLLQAEYLGVTQATAPLEKAGDDPRMQRLLGVDYATAQGLGLPHDWSRKVLSAVGNYAEIYDRSVGPGTQLNLARGYNALWSAGGVLAPLPLQ